MIHIDLRQPLEHRISSAARNPKVLFASALKDPAILASLFMVLAAGTSALLLEKQLTARESALQEDLARAGEEMVSLGDALDRADELRAEQERLENRIRAIGTLDPDRYAFVRLMDQVAGGTPDNTWIDALVVDSRDGADGSLHFRVRGFSPSVDLVSAFQRNLLDSGVVREIRLTASGSTQIGDVPVIRFELSGVSGVGSPAGVLIEASFGREDAGYARHAGVDAVDLEGAP